MMEALAFRAADFSDFPRLITMWKDCFNESDESASDIFMHLQKPENIFVLAGKDGPAAMLSIREFSLTTPFGLYKAAYIYGVATSPAERGRGYCTALLKDIDALLARRKYACSVLVPASESLFGFYERHGYEKAFNINKAEFTAEEISRGKTYPLKKIGAAELLLIRDARFADSKMYARWDAEYLDYIADESGRNGGGVYAAAIDGKQICAVCYKSGDTMIIKELGATFDALEEAIRSIHAHFGENKYKLYLREDVKISYTNNSLPFAMIKWYDSGVKARMPVCEGAPPYITHVLD